MQEERSEVTAEQRSIAARWRCKTGRAGALEARGQDAEPISYALRDHRGALVRV
jgi:hypothetical protein